MAHALIDTNMLMAVAQGFDLFGILEQEHPHLSPAIMQGTLRELQSIKTTGTGAQKRAARLAEQLIPRQHLNIVPQSVTHVDDALLAVATKTASAIVTQDKALQKRARNAKIPVLAIRSKKKLCHIP